MFCFVSAVSVGTDPLYISHVSNRTCSNCFSTGRTPGPEPDSCRSAHHLPAIRHQHRLAQRRLTHPAAPGRPSLSAPLQPGWGRAHRPRRSYHSRPKGRRGQKGHLGSPGRARDLQQRERQTRSSRFWTSKSFWTRCNLKVKREGRDRNFCSRPRRKPGPGAGDGDRLRHFFSFFFVSFCLLRNQLKPERQISVCSSQRWLSSRSVPPLCLRTFLNATFFSPHNSRVIDHIFQSTSLFLL